MMNKYLETLTQSLNYHESVYNCNEVACPRSMGDSVLSRQPNHNAPARKKLKKSPENFQRLSSVPFIKHWFQHTQIQFELGKATINHVQFPLYELLGF